MKLKSSPKLVVAVISGLHMIEVNTTTNSRQVITGGTEGMFLKDILVKLGMPYELVCPADGEYGRLRSNGSWSGLIGMVERGEADLACGGLAITEQRTKTVDFSTAYAASQRTFAIRRPKKVHLKNAYLFPFQVPVWVCFLGILLIMSTVLCISLQRDYSIRRIIFEAFGSILRQPFIIGGSSWKLKLLKALCGIYSLMMTTAYSGVLLSFMTVPVEEKGIENFQQLSAAVLGGSHRCLTVRGTLAVHNLLTSDKKYLQDLGKAIERNSWYLSSHELLTLTDIPHNTAIITYRMYLELLFHGNVEQKSNNLISKDSLPMMINGIAIKRNFCCGEKLNKVIAALLQAGLFEKYLHDASFKKRLFVNQTNEGVGRNQKISVESITGTLVMLCLGYIISCLTLLAETIIYRYRLNIH